MFCKSYDFVKSYDQNFLQRYELFVAKKNDIVMFFLKIEGAVVKLQCNNDKAKLVLKANTDKKGYFYIGGPKNSTSYATRHCNVVLDSAPNGLKPSNLHGGLTGALLKHVKRPMSKGVSLKLYTVGPFVFVPKCHN